MGSNGVKKLCYTDSDDGVPFEGGTWFCLTCWNLIIDQIKKDGVFE